MSWRGGKVGEGAGKPPPPAPSNRWWGQRGKRPSLRWGAPPRAAGQNWGAEGIPKSVAPRSPTRTTLFPARSLTKATFFRAAQNTRSRRTTDDPAPLSLESQHRSCAGAGGAGHVAVLQPPPHALAAPPTPSGRCALTPAPQSRRRGEMGRGVEARSRQGARSQSQPTLVASSLLRSIRARVRDSIRDIIQREPRSDAADPGVQLRRGRGPAARVGLRDRKSESPSPGTQRQFLKP